MLISGRPPDDLAVPVQICRLGDDQSITPVWRNGLGGLTFQIGSGPSRRCAKWAPAGSGLDLSAEVERLRWASQFASVPVVLDHVSDSDGAWMLTAGVPGDSAVSDYWKANPATAVRAAGVGLRALHDALPVDRCPFTWSVEDRIAEAAVARDDAASDLPCAPPIDKLVVCHGDACVPNTLITEDGQYSGQVDMANSVRLTAGPTSPSRPGVPSGTTGQAGRRPCFPPMGWSPIRIGLRTTACSGLSTPHLPRPADGCKTQAGAVTSSGEDGALAAAGPARPGTPWSIRANFPGWTRSRP